MGNYLFTTQVQFHMSRKQISRAFSALTAACEGYDGLDPADCDRVIAYINDPLTEKDSIRDAFVKIIEMLNWRVTFNDEWDINDIEHIVDYPADEERLFAILAPYITQGSFITFDEQRYGDTYRYRYAFTGTRMLEQEPHYDPVPDEREEVSAIEVTSPC